MFVTCVEAAAGDYDIAKYVENLFRTYLLFCRWFSSQIFI